MTGHSHHSHAITPASGSARCLGATDYAGETGAGALSPCAEAQVQINEAQADLERALDSLFQRLNDACNAGPCVGANDSKGEPAASDLHGRLLGIAQRTRQHAAAVRDVTSRLTL